MTSFCCVASQEMAEISKVPESISIAVATGDTIAIFSANTKTNAFELRNEIHCHGPIEAMAMSKVAIPVFEVALSVTLNF